jgi:long-chain acyl-CoA synthetase
LRELYVPLPDAPPPTGGLADSVYDHALRDPHRVALGRKDASGRWQDVTAEQFRDEVLGVAKGLIAQGVRFGDRVALMSRTRYEWTVVDYAIWSVGAQSVPVHPSAPADQVCRILRDTGVSACVVEHEDHAMTVGSVMDRLPSLRRLWQLDSGAVESLRAAGARIGDEVVHRHRRAVTPDSVATVVHTSGATGGPRACVLTHAGLMVQGDALGGGPEGAFGGRPGTAPATLLFLPLAHVLGRVAQVAAVRWGARLAHRPSFGAAELLPDLESYRPTFLVGVPYVFEGVYAAARRRAEREGRGAAFERAVEVAVRYAEALEHRNFGLGPGPSAALRLQHQYFEKAVYGRLRESLGGRVRHAVSGGSGLDRRLGLFFAGAGVTVFEGYGLTETSGAATANPPGRTRFGTVGRPVPGTTVHIAEDGEVWLHGPQVFAGYHGDQAATDAVLHGGWLATGDLGSLDADGYLSLTGRKREVLVTSGGRTVSPPVLEARVRSHPLVAQCVVVGHERPFAAALITIDPEAVAHWLAMRGLPPAEPGRVVRDPQLETEVRRAVVAANSLVPRAEAIRTFRILARPFTEEEGLLTPSFELRRAAIEAAYAMEVDALYR